MAAATAAACLGVTDSPRNTEPPRTPKAVDVSRSPDTRPSGLVRDAISTSRDAVTPEMCIRDRRRATKPRSLYLHGMRVTTVTQTLVDLAAVLDGAQLDLALIHI